MAAIRFDGEDRPEAWEWSDCESAREGKEGTGDAV